MLWGFGVARLHVIVTSLLGWLLAELLVLRLCKVPFTCTYLPGRSEVKTMWPIYFTAFTTFSFSMAGLELQMLRWPRVLIAFIVVAARAAIATRVLRRLWITSDPALRFAEEEHGALFEGFHLSEGLAADGEDRPGARRSRCRGARWRWSAHEPPLIRSLLPGSQGSSTSLCLGLLSVKTETEGPSGAPASSAA